MATIDVTAFARSPEALALRFDASELPGLLSKRLVVPDGTCVLLAHPDGREELLRAAQEGVGPFAAVLVKSIDQAVTFEVDGLQTSQGREARAGIEVVLRLPQREIGVRALASTLLAGGPRLDVEALRSYLEPYVRGGLARFVRARTAEVLLLEDPRPALRPLLEDELKAPCFAAGLQVLDIRHPSFACPSFEEYVRQRAEAEAREEALRQHEQIQSMRARVERNEALQRHDLEELARVLEYRGLVKELERKQEVDRRRKEDEIARFEAVQSRVGKDDLKALIFLLEDDRLKAQLIQRLIERDMTPDQIRAKQAADLEQRLEERLEGFARKLGAVATERDRRVRERGQRTRRLVVAYGKQVAAYDPTTDLHREAPKEIYDLRHGALGYVRSVRAATTRSLGRVLLVGAQGGAYVVREGAAGAVARELRFPRPPDGQGGVNAAAYFDGWVYATHSELGVFRWDLDGLVRPEPLFQHATARHDATRGAVTTADGKLYFSSGPDVFRFDLVRPDEPLASFRGTGEGVTAFVETKDELFAGTREGRVIRWSLSDPGSPRELHVRKANPIYMLRIAEVGGAPHLLIGAKEHGLTAVSIEDGRATDYYAPDQIRWVDGATDHVYGVTRGGYAVHVWSADRVEKPLFALHLPDRVQDLLVLKEPCGDAGLA